MGRRKRLKKFESVLAYKTQCIAAMERVNSRKTHEKDTDFVRIVFYEYI